MLTKNIMFNVVLEGHHLYCSMNQLLIV